MSQDCVRGATVPSGGVNEQGDVILADRAVFALVPVIALKAFRYKAAR